jgi:alpha-2-macroglobulin
MQKHYLATIIFCIFFATVNAQYKLTKLQIENQLVQGNKLTDLLADIAADAKVAIALKDDGIAAQLFYYAAAVNNEIYEDTSYFTRSYFIDTLVKSKTTTPTLKGAMYILKAQRLNNFYNTKNTNRTRLAFYKNADSINFTKTTNTQITNLIQGYYDTAAVLMQKTNALNWLWLLGNYQNNLLINPNIDDVIYFKQYLECTKVEDYVTGANYGQIFTATETQFWAVIDTTRIGYNKLSILKKWYNKKVVSKNKEATDYLTIFARIDAHLAHSRYYNTKELNKSFINNLNPLLQSPYGSVKALVVKNLFNTFYSLGQQYNNINTSYYGHYQYQDYQGQFDTSLKNGYINAIALYNRYNNLLDSFPQIKEGIYYQMQTIQQPQAAIKIKNTQLPNQPIAALLHFKNTNTFYYKIFVTGLNKAPTGYVRYDSITLPTTTDYLLHNTAIKLNGLPAGNYDIFVAADNFLDTLHIHKSSFRVTNIATMQNGHSLFIVDSYSGLPLKNIGVAFYKTIYDKITNSYKDSLVQSTTTNAEGFVKLSTNGNWAQINANNTDSVRMDYTFNEAIVNGKTPREEEVYTKEEYEDGKAEYYEDNLNAVTNTDRAIYRPGQKVFFKTILYTKHAKTGLAIVFTPKTIGTKNFNEICDAQGGKVTVQLKNPFGKIVDSVVTTINNFGSLTGTFTIPKNGATGQYSIDFKDVYVNHEDGDYVLVEEYKRPTFTAKIEMPKQHLVLKDSFAIKVVVTSFAGAPLQNIQVAYTVDRTVNSSNIFNSVGSNLDKNNSAFFETYKKEIFDTTGQTNAKGELVIPITDTALQRLIITNYQKLTASYSINATLTDPTGEALDVEGDFSVSCKPIAISFAPARQVNVATDSTLNVTTKKLGGADFNGKLVVKYYQQQPPSLDTFEHLGNIDIETYPIQQWQQWFPSIVYQSEAAPTAINNVTAPTPFFTDTIAINGFGKYNLAKLNLPVAKYNTEVIALSNDTIVGTTTASFTILNTQQPNWPITNQLFVYAPNTTLNKNTNGLHYIVGGKTSANVVQCIGYYKKHKGKHYAHYQYKTIALQANTVQAVTLQIPKTTSGDLFYSYMYLYKNTLYSTQNKYFKPYAGTTPIAIQIENYRNKTTPGATEQINVSVTLNNKNANAELMSTMFDAALEPIHPYELVLPPSYTLRQEPQHVNMVFGWSNQTPSYTYSNNISWYEYGLFPAAQNLFATKKAPTTTTTFPQDNWWKKQTAPPSNKFLGATSNLNEVVVVGYGTRIKKDESGSVAVVSPATGLAGKIAGLQIQAEYVTGTNRLSSIKIRGVSSVNGNNDALIILDGVAITSKALEGMDARTINDVVVLNDAAATAIYGARAANGVVVISTKGPIVLSELLATAPQTPPPPLVIRSNFNETAHFLPQVHANKNGTYTLNYTMPQSVTKYKWHLLAHTKNLNFAQYVTEVISNLPFMVQPNMPRYLYQGDILQLKTRVTNTSPDSLNGNMVYSVEDLVTGQDVTAQFISTTKAPLTIGANANNTQTVQIKVPNNFTNPVKIKVGASTNLFTDGEAYDIPILTQKRFLSTTTNFTAAPNNTITLALPTLAPTDKAVGHQTALTPMGNAQLLYAMPSVANYAFDCAEQAVNKLAIFLTSKKLLATDTALQNAFNNYATAHQTDNNPGLPAAQSMPWAQLNNQTAIQNQQLYTVLNNSQNPQTLSGLIARIKQLQLPNGGLAWFNGGPVSPYMSNYVLQRLGQIFKATDSLANINTPEFAPLLSLAQQLTKYADAAFTTEFITANNYYNQNYLLARGYWLNTFTPDSAVAAKIKTQIANAALYGTASNVISKAQLIQLLQPYQNYLTNKQLIPTETENIKQLAITDDEHGTRWKIISNQDFLDYYTEEKIALLAQLFKNNKAMHSGIKKWLFTYRAGHAWGSTKATAAVINALLITDTVVAATAATANITIGQNSCTLSNQVLSNQLANYTSTTNMPANAIISNTSNNTAQGNITQYYFGTQLPANSNVQIQKQLQYKNAAGAWVPLQANTAVSIGTIIKVRVTINTTQPLQYAYITDSKNAALDFVETQSGYYYGNNLSFYKVVRDAGLELFAEKIPMGESYYEYELRTAKQGTFNTGISSIECLYAPGMQAYTNTPTITVN